MIIDHLSESPTCLHCDMDETVGHSMLHCLKYDDCRTKLINTLQLNYSIYKTIEIRTKDLLSGNQNLTYTQNILLDIVIEYIKGTKIFVLYIKKH